MILPSALERLARRQRRIPTAQKRQSQRLSHMHAIDQMARRQVYRSQGEIQTLPKPPADEPSPSRETALHRGCCLALHALWSVKFPLPDILHIVAQFQGQSAVIRVSWQVRTSADACRDAAKSIRRHGPSLSNQSGTGAPKGKNMRLGRVFQLKAHFFRRPFRPSRTASPQPHP
jgi:hypothetical protein